MNIPSSNSQVEMEINSSQNGKVALAADDKKLHPRPQPNRVEKCPRCDSGNTKFCYYNNYSLSQPRYFCKGCRRYWTKGGTLRNVPVGGGCRKNRRSAKLAFDNYHNHLLVQSHNLIENNNKNNVMLSTATHSCLKLADHSNFSSPLRYEDSGTCDSLSLAFATLQRQSNVQHLGFECHPQNPILGRQPITSSSNNTLGFLNNFVEPHTTSSFKYYGFENGTQSQTDHLHQKQPFLHSDEDLSLSNMASKGLLGLPWQVGNDNNGGVGQGLVEKGNSNVALGTGSNNNYNNDGCCEVVESGGRSERWKNNNTGLVEAAAGVSSWPNLINTVALIM